MLGVGLVRKAAADVIGDNHPVGGAELFDQAPEIERPGGIAVQHDQRLAPALVQVVVAQAANRQVVALKGRDGETVKGLPACASPDHAQHETIQTAADAQKADPIAGL